MKTRKSILNIALAAMASICMITALSEVAHADRVGNPNGDGAFALENPNEDSRIPGFYALLKAFNESKGFVLPLDSSENDNYITLIDDKATIFGYKVNLSDNSISNFGYNLLLNSFEEIRGRYNSEIDIENLFDIEWGIDRIKSYSINSSIEDNLTILKNSSFPSELGGIMNSEQRVELGFYYPGSWFSKKFYFQYYSDLILSNGKLKSRDGSSEMRSYKNGYILLRKFVKIKYTKQFTSRGYIDNTTYANVCSDRIEYIRALYREKYGVLSGVIDSVTDKPCKITYIYKRQN